MKILKLRALCAILLTLALTACLFAPAFAVSSSELQDQLDELEKQADELDAQRRELQEQIDANDAETLSVVDQRAKVDHDVSLIYDQIQNLNAQLKQYNLLIAEKQSELDELQSSQTDLLARYKQRLRAMQEQGDISYWAVVFKASSFAEMLNRLAMVEEIAKSDQRMMQELRDMATGILDAKNALAEEKVAAEEKKLELASAQEQLDAKRAESEELLDKLISDAELLKEEDAKYDSLKADLLDEIAQKEKEYTKQLEAERRAQEEANRNNGSSGGNGGSGTNENGEPFTPAPSSENFIFPLPTNIGSRVTSPYGYRYHPVTGVYKLHNGVDFAAYAGRPIYASKSGKVTTATYSNAWGNYVVINHGDGYSTLYAHMTNYIVSYGQYVEQGQTIGYVGSTGNSTGNHCHFEMSYNGALFSAYTLFAGM